MFQSGPFRGDSHVRQGKRCVRIMTIVKKNQAEKNNLIVKSWCLFSPSWRLSWEERRRKLDPWQKCYAEESAWSHQTELHLWERHSTSPIKMAWVNTIQITIIALIEPPATFRPKHSTVTVVTIIIPVVSRELHVVVVIQLVASVSTVPRNSQCVLVGCVANGEPTVFDVLSTSQLYSQFCRANGSQ